ncbi:MAG: glycosyltransferase family 39 protein [Planctomycetes bacterium]|nr:glycosyltransferase family 39 protein [Planctomycetota bacterium]
MKPPRLLAPAVILALALALRLALFTGFQASDDLNYIRYVARMNAGTYVLESNPFATRFGLLVPMAAAFRLFGPGIVQAILPNLIASLACVLLAFAVGRRLADGRTALLAALLAAFLPVNIHHATEVHADLPMAAWMGLSAFLWLGSSGRMRPAFLAGLALGAAHLTKEPAFFLFAFVFPHGLLAADRRRPLAAFVAGFALVAIAEVAAYGIAGDPLFRIRSTGGGHAQDVEQHYATAGQILHRLFVEMPSMLFNPMSPMAPFFGIFYLAFAAAAAHVWIAKDRAGRLALLWWLALFACMNFFPLSLSPFRPGFVARPRTLEPLTIPAVLVVARSAVLLASRRRMLSAALGAVLLVDILAAVRLHRDAPLARENIVAAHRFLSGRDPGRVVSDRRMVEALEFLDRFRSRHRYAVWSDAPPGEPCLVVFDGYWLGNDLKYYGMSPPAWTKRLPAPLHEHSAPLPRSIRHPRPTGRGPKLEIREWRP